MKKVLIVDDDALVRMFLRQIIPREPEGYTIAGDARDGEEALEMAAQFAPDLVISDVSMPTLDGVELVRRLRASHFSGGIIMLSCHDDFDYVKNAMQLGADEYLLKNHLSPDSLRAALQTVAEKRGAALAAPALAALAQKGQRALQQEALERLLSEDCTDSEQSILKSAGLGGRYTACTVLFLRVPSDAAWQSVFDLCCQMAAAGDLPDVEAVQVGQRGCAFLLDLSGQPSELARGERARMLAARIELNLQTYLHLRSMLGVSRPCGGAHAVSDALRQANEALVASFYGAGVYWSGEPESVLTDRVPEEASRFLKCLPTLLGKDADDLLAAYAGALAAFAQARTLPGIVLRWLQACDQSAGVSRPLKQYAALNTLSAYHPCAEEWLEQARTRTARQLPQGLSPQITAAVRYLQAHFAEPVSLGDAAAAAGFHPSYFSTTFKQELGQGFSEYLTELRLAQVRERLAGSSATIKEIARQAGFIDYQHFCKTFKKKNGLSPAAYRREKQK